MRVDRNLIGWGLFFIVFGGVILAVRQGLVPADVAGRAWQLWPLLLVAAGVSMVLAGKPGAWLGGIVASVCFGLIAGGLVASGTGIPFVGCGASEDGTAFERQSGELASGSRLGIEFRCGELAVGTAPGATWEVTGLSDEGVPPEVDRDDDGVDLEPGSGGVFGFAGKRERWEVVVPADPSISLDVTLNAGEGQLVLADAHLDEVETTVNAGSLTVDLRDVAAAATLDGTVNAGQLVVWLPERPLDGGLTVNAGSLAICAPEGAGLRLVSGGALSSNDFEDAGLVRSGDAWETPDFATAPIRITLDVTANAGSMSLDPQDECAG